MGNVETNIQIKHLIGNSNCVILCELFYIIKFIIEQVKLVSE